MTKEELKKEAKDSWWNDDNCSGALPTEKIYECGYLAGAEFGYKLAHEEMDYLNKHWGSEEERKANEWHYVKDEGLPVNKNDGATYLLYTIYGEGGSPVVAHFAYRDKQELMNVWTGAILTEDKIIAWKEIVLPKESK